MLSFFVKIKNKKSATKCERETKTRDRIQRMYGCFKGNLIVGCIWNCDLQMGLFDFDWPFFYLVLRTCWITNIKREIIRIVDIFNSFLFMVIKFTAVFQLFFFPGKIENLMLFFFFGFAGLLGIIRGVSFWQILHIWGSLVNNIFFFFFVMCICVIVFYLNFYLSKTHHLS